MSNSPQPVPGSLTIFMVGDIGWIGEEIFAQSKGQQAEKDD
jgi:hypothetical protein